MKISKEHIGKKLRNKNHGISSYFIPMYIHEDINCVIGRNHKNQIVMYDGRTYFNDEWELVQEIPKNQSWVVPGKKYVYRDSIGHPKNWFIPQKYNFKDGLWEGLGSGGKNDWAVMGFQSEWEEVLEKETIKVVLAPALYLENNQETVSRTLYASEEEAKQHLRGKKFIRWPVAYFIETERTVVKD